MKKSTKFFCILSICFVALGLILCGIAFLFGADFNDLTKQFSNSKFLSYFYRNDNSDLDKDALIWENPNISQQTYFFVEPEGKNYPIKSLEINIDSCSLIFQKGESLQIKAANLFENNISCKITKSGVFKIQDSSSFGLLNIFSRKSFSENGVIEITLPSSLTLENITIKNNNGSISIVDNSFLCNKLYIQNENGDISLSNFSSNQAKISTNYGSINLDGKMLNETKVICASGKINLQISNDFSYKVQNGMGSVNINGESFSTSSTKSSSLKNQNNIDIQCKLGSVRVFSK